MVPPAPRIGHPRCVRRRRQPASVRYRLPRGRLGAATRLAVRL